jgi:hypothetical protein
MAEAQLLIRWCARSLTDAERLALAELANDVARSRRKNYTLAKQRRSGLRKMRREFRRLGLRSTSDLLSE